ncbi:MAG: hypothetical protein CMP51_04505 [Flavobacteriales bacterium]|nr:hypothetical protein [Flavobacteriales bacterium]
MKKNIIQNYPIILAAIAVYINYNYELFPEILQENKLPFALIIFGLAVYATFLLRKKVNNTLKDSEKKQTIEKKENSSETMENVQDNVNKTAVYIENNWKRLVVYLGIIVVFTLYYKTILSFVGFNFSDENQENVISAEMFMAEKNFALKNYDKALNGDSTIIDSIVYYHDGFKDISIKNAETQTGNLALLYSAICELNLNKYDDALISLNKFKTDDKLFNSLSIGLKGDVNHELDNLDIALNLYQEAVNTSDNPTVKSRYLMKQAFIHESQNDFSKALEIYQNIKEKYPNTLESSTIDKYISNVNNR